MISSGTIQRKPATGDLIQSMNSHLCGVKTRHQYVMVKHERLISVRFKPWALYHFIRLPMHHLVNESIEASYLFGTEFKSLEGAVFEAGDFGKQVDLIEAFLLNWLNREDVAPHALFDHLIEKFLASYTHFNAIKFSSYAGVSQRTLNRMFKQYLGIGPKAFTGLLRTLESSKMIASSPKLKVLDVALENGYYDQMHFVKDMKKHNGLSPSAFKELDKSLQMQVLTKA